MTHMMTDIATALRTVAAVLFLLLVGFGAPLMDMPLALAAWSLVLVMSLVDLWCLRRMRRATRATRALLSEAMILVAAGSTLATSVALSAVNGETGAADLALLAVVAYLAWRGWVVARHLRRGTEPAPRVSGIEDSRRMIAGLRSQLSRRDRTGT
jgi:hypothetical protein